MSPTIAVIVYCVGSAAKKAIPNGEMIPNIFAAIKMKDKIPTAAAFSMTALVAMVRFGVSIALAFILMTMPENYTKIVAELAWSRHRLSF